MYLYHRPTFKPYLLLLAGLVLSISGFAQMQIPTPSEQTWTAEAIKHTSEHNAKTIPKLVTSVKEAAKKAFREAEKKIRNIIRKDPPLLFSPRQATSKKQIQLTTTKQSQSATASPTYATPTDADNRTLPFNSRLRIAAMSGDHFALANTLKELASLDRQTQLRIINHVDATGRKALDDAVFACHTEIVQTLLQAGSHTIATDFDTLARQQLHAFAKAGNTQCLARLCQNMHALEDYLRLQMISGPDKTGWNALHYAALYGHCGCVQILLDMGAEHDIVAPMKNGVYLTPLEIARKQAETDFLRYESTIATLEAYTTEGRLRTLAKTGDYPALQQLLRHINTLEKYVQLQIINDTDTKGQSALDYATRGGHFACQQELLSAGANVSLQYFILLASKQLHTWISEGDCESLTDFFETGLRPRFLKKIAPQDDNIHSQILNHIDVTTGRNALDEAIFNAYPDCIQALIDAGAHTSTRNFVALAGEQLHTLVKTNNGEALQTFLKHIFTRETQASWKIIHAMDAFGWNALHHAIVRGSLHGVQTLLDAGIRLDIKAPTGHQTYMTPLEIAYSLANTSLEQYKVSQPLIALLEKAEERARVQAGVPPSSVSYSPNRQDTVATHPNNNDKNYRRLRQELRELIQKGDTAYLEKFLTKSQCPESAINFCDEQEQTLLHDAVWNNHLSCARILLNAGARLDVRAQCDHGCRMTALQLAYLVGSADMIELLECQLKPLLWQTLYQAIESGDHRRLGNLLKGISSQYRFLPALLAYTDAHHWSLLHYAVHLGHTRCVAYLMQFKADPHLSPAPKKITAHTPLQMAQIQQKKQPEYTLIVKILKGSYPITAWLEEDEHDFIPTPTANPYHLAGCVRLLKKLFPHVEHTFFIKYMYNNPLTQKMIDVHTGLQRTGVNNDARLTQDIADLALYSEALAETTTIDHSIPDSWSEITQRLSDTTNPKDLQQRLSVVIPIVQFLYQDVIDLGWSDQHWFETCFDYQSCCGQWISPESLLNQLREKHYLTAGQYKTCEVYLTTYWGE